MATENTKQLSAFAYYNDTGESGEYHGYAMQKGDHIRWQISRYVGFPKNGFKVFDSNNREILQVNLPPSKAVFMDRVASGIEDSNLVKTLERRFNHITDSSGNTYLDQIFLAIDKITNNSVLPQYLVEEKIKNGSSIGYLDMLLISSIDPYMAKGLGLYIILPFRDIWSVGNNTEFYHFGYTIQGDWGDTESPLLIDKIQSLYSTLENFDVLNLNHSRIEARARKVNIYIDNLKSEKYISIYGDIKSQWTIHVNENMKEFVFYLKINNRNQINYYKSFDWIILSHEIPTFPSLTPEILFSTGIHSFKYETKEVNINGSDYLQLKVYKENRDSSFNRLVFHQSPTSIHLARHIEYKKEPLGIIGTLRDSTKKAGRNFNQFVNYSLNENSIPELNFASCLQKPAIPFFDENGNILKRATDLFMRIKYNFHPVEDLVPIRFELKRSYNPFSNSSGRGHKNRILTVDDYDFLQPQVINQSTPKPHLPDLLAYFPFDGILANIKNGKYPRLFGNLRYQKLNIGTGIKFLSRNRRSSYLRVGGNLFSKIGKQFTISFKTNLRSLFANVAFFHSENKDVLSLSTNQIGNLIFKLNGTAYQTTYSLENSFFYSGKNNEIWMIVSVNERTLRISCKPIRNSNSSVNFGNSNDPWVNTGVPINLLANYHNGTQKFTIENNKNLDEVGNHFFIGKSLGAQRGYQGVLKDFSIWKSSLNHFDIYSTAPELLTLKENLQKHSLQFCYIDRIKLDTDNAYVISEYSEIGYLGKRATIQLWFKLNITYGEDKNCKILELFNAGAQITIKTSVSGRGSTEDVEITGFDISHNGIREIEWKYLQWNKLTILFNGSDSEIYINNQVIGFFSFSKSIDINSLKLGEHTGDQFTHLTVWNEALSPTEIDERLGQVQYIDRQLLDGKYNYQIKGIDLLGRISENPTTKTINCKAGIPTIDTPTSTFARTTPLIGQIDAIQITEEKKVNEFSNSDKKFEYETVKKKLTISVNKNAVDFNDDWVSYFPSHYMTITRTVDDKNYRQRFEISESNSEVDKIIFICYEPPFSQMLPAKGDNFSIDIDLKTTIDWKCTGLQQVYNPEVDRFVLHTHFGDRNTIVSKVTKVLSVNEDGLRKIYTFKIGKVPLINKNNEQRFKGLFARIGSNSYEIKMVVSGANPKITVTANAYGMPAVHMGQNIAIVINDSFDEYQLFNEARQWNHPREDISMKPIVPIVATKVSKESFKKSELEQKGVSWLPEKNVEKVILSGIDPSYVQENPLVDDYVPSALVGKIAVSTGYQWDAFTVLWHEWEQNKLVCYFLTKKDAKNNYPSLAFTEAKFYTGKHYFHPFKISNPPYLQNFSKSTYAFGISAASKDGHSSEVSAPANVVLVDKRVPPPPERPVAVSDGIADYYKKIKVNLSWIGDSKYYNVYSSSFATVAATDLESRRLSRGDYKKVVTDKSFAFIGDNYWTHWIETIKNRTWYDPLKNNEPFTVDVTPDKLDVLFPAKDSKEWRRMSIIWQNWADRFYGGLTDDQKVVLAETEGNEEAFTLLNTKPIEENTYEDEVTGYYPDSFLYRVRSQSDSLVINTEWSPVSYPVKPKLCRKPRRPELSKVIPGDRSITLYWNLNRERQLSHYLIYRAVNKEALEDLRWWRDYPDPRIVGKVEDPRIKTLDHSIVIQTNDVIQDIIGVYRATEFDYQETDYIAFNRAFNYYGNQSSFVNHPQDEEQQVECIISKLKPIADYTPVVIIYRTETREICVQDTINAHPKLKVRNGVLRLPPFLEIKEILGIYKVDEFDNSVSPITNQSTKNFFFLNDAQTKTALWIKNTEGDSIHNLFNLKESTNVVLTYSDKNDFIKILMNYKVPLKFKDKGLVGLKNYFYIITCILDFDGLYISNYSSKVRTSSLLIKNNRSLKVELFRTKKSDSIDLIEIKILPLSKDIEVLTKFKETNEVYWGILEGWMSTEKDVIMKYEAFKDDCLLFEVTAKESGILNASQFYQSNPINQ